MEIFHASPGFKGQASIVRSKNDAFPLFADRPPVPQTPQAGGWRYLSDLSRSELEDYLDEITLRPRRDDGFPSQCRHVGEFFGQWWRQQCERGWPVDSYRAVSMLATVGSSPINVRAYSYIGGSEPSRDSASVIKTVSAPKRFGGEEPPIRRATLPAVLDGELT